MITERGAYQLVDEAVREQDIPKLLRAMEVYAAYMRRMVACDSNDSSESLATVKDLGPEDFEAGAKATQRIAVLVARTYAQAVMIAKGVA